MAVSGGRRLYGGGTLMQGKLTILGLFDALTAEDEDEQDLQEVMEL